MSLKFLSGVKVLPSDDKQTKPVLFYNFIKNSGPYVKLSLVII